MRVLSRIVLATLGSLGDFHPYLALGAALKSRGHDVAIATSPFYQARVERENLDYFPLRPDLADEMNSSHEIARHAHDIKHGTQYVLKTLVLPRVQETYDDLCVACRGADLVVNHAVLFPTPIVAGRLGLKWISVILSPGIFLSACDPPVLPPLARFNSVRGLGPLPHRILHALVDRATRPWFTPVHELRARAGLPPDSRNPATSGMMSPDGTLAMFSRVLGEPQPDWPANTEVTGFAFYDEPRREPERDLMRFLDSGEPPIVFTLGSDASTDANDFYAQSLEAVRQVRCRAVFLTGYDERNRLRGALPDGVAVQEYASYARLFPRAKLVVHSGGIGTIAQTLRAGVPMLVVPFAADQPDNGARVERRGFGRSIWRDRYDSRRAASLISELLNRPRYGESVRAAQKRILAEDGIDSACAFVERVLSTPVACY